MSNSTRKREPLGARRGATAARLAETAALDEDSLRLSRKATRGKPADPESDKTPEPPGLPDQSTPGVGVESTGVGEESTGVDDKSTEVDSESTDHVDSTPALVEPPNGGEVPYSPDSDPTIEPLPEPKPRPRSDFRDALQIFAWTTTQDLWDRYANLALQLRKDSGQRIATAEVIRAVLEQNMPNAETRTGVAALADYAERWTDLRARTRTTQKAQNFRLRRRDAEALERAQLSLLEDRGTNVAIGRMISGIVNENFPSPAEAKRLLKLP